MMKKRYQVFVSSTYKDLREERDAISKAILRMDHIPAGMELFGSDADDSWEVIKRAIKLSDYLVLILAGRYGSVSEKAGLSFTEMEFDFAKKEGVPVLAFIYSDPSSLLSAYVDHGEQAKMLEAFREKVKRTGQVAYWSDKRELAGSVTSDLHKVFTNRPRPGWVRGDAVGRPDDEAKSASPNINVEFIDIENENVLGKEIQHIVEVWSVPDRIPDFAGSEDTYGGLSFTASNPNKDFFRDVTKFVQVWGQCKPIGLSIANTGRAVARDVHVEISVSVVGGLDVRTDGQMPSSPCTDYVTSVTWSRKSEYDDPHIGRVKVRRAGETFKITVECGSLQPGRRVLSDKFYLGATQAAILELQAEIFSENMEPTRDTLTINNGQGPRELTMDMLRESQYIEDWGVD